MKTPKNNSKNQWWTEDLWKNSDEKPQGVLLKKQEFLKLGVEKFHFLQKNQNYQKYQSVIFSFFELWH